MPKATTDFGDLISLEDFYISIPGLANPITFKALPDLSDNKSASYNDESIMGRSSPLKTYSHSDNRSFNLQLHLYVLRQSDAQTNLNILRAIQSAVYTRESTGGAPFIPPPVCVIKCGQLLSAVPICVILKSYSVKFPTDVPWDAATYIPWKMDIDTTWEKVYRSSDLPGQSRIISQGS